MLKIAIDATPVSPQSTGVGFYVANLIQSLHLLQDKEQFELGIIYQPGIKNWLRGNWKFPESLEQYHPRHFFPLPVRVSDILIDRNVKTIFSYFENKCDRPDILHGTNYTVYPFQKSQNIITIYDLTFLKYPDYIDSVVEAYAERLKRCLTWTDAVLTISESSKRDIIEYLNIPPERIYVTPLASRYYPDYLSEETRDRVATQTNYDFSIPYLLFVSTIEPRKNINSLIAAFDRLKKQYKIPHHLILIGRKGWRYESIFNAIASSPYNNNIHHLDYLSDELLALFYAKADVFVYPSYYEGFGLPVLEAMTLNAPVVAANTASIPEVAGDAALLIDPHDSIQLAEAILQVISDSQLRELLIQKGRERAKLFTWRRTARETLNAYQMFRK